MPTAKRRKSKPSPNLLAGRPSSVAASILPLPPPSEGAVVVSATDEGLGVSFPAYDPALAHWWHVARPQSAGPMPVTQLLPAARVTTGPAFRVRRGRLAWAPETSPSCRVSTAVRHLGRNVEGHLGWTIVGWVRAP